MGSIADGQQDGWAVERINITERWIPSQASTSVLSLHYRPQTVRAVQKMRTPLKQLSLHYNLGTGLYFKGTVRVISTDTP